ncbi:MAG: hypothetical protein WCL00_14660, partial [Bacteroidota bacterium]
MRTGIIAGYIILIPLLSLSQGEFNTWYFGTYAGMSFNSGNPVALPPNPMAQGGLAAGSSVSDSLGNILFYSDGIKIWDRNNNVMPNGFGLLGGGGKNQAALSVQSIIDKNKYFLFTVGYKSIPLLPLRGLYYSVLDMQLNGGLGDIVPGMKNIPLPMGDSAIVQLTATRHQNNRDAWVIVLRHGTTEQYLSYLIDPAGLHTTPIVSTSNLKNRIRPIFNSGESGFIRISPNSEYLICTDSLTEMCNFNASTGVVTPKFRFWPYLSGGYSTGAEYSIDSRYLYLTTEGESPIYYPLMQYNMNNEDSLSFKQSQVMIGDSSSWSIQMAPDGKIYLTTWPNNDSLNIINNPSSPGSACNYQKNAFCLQGNVHYWCLPQFLQKYKAYVNHTNGCMADSMHYSADIWPPAD